MKVLTIGEAAKQAWNMRTGMRANGVHTDVLTTKSSPYGYPADRCLNLSYESLPEKVWSSMIKTREFIKSFLKYDVFNYFYPMPLAPKVMDFRVLKKSSKPIFMTFHGSDSRINSIASDLNPHYVSTIQPNPENKIRDRLELFSQFCDQAVISYPELRPYVEPYFDNVVHIPRTVSVENLEPSYNIGSEKPLIVHSPSDRKKKGTESIRGAVDALQNEFEFEFRILEGMDNNRIIETFQEADIMIDQLRIGTYGVAALKAMACGTPAIAYIRDDLLNKQPSELPIINANPDTIESVLRELLADPETLTEAGRVSRKYVEAHHDRREVAKDWIDLYQQHIG